eukprot:SAG11_NODE_220_length_12154_cov_92.233347_9_plen_300_part_00
MHGRETSGRRDGGPGGDVHGRSCGLGGGSHGSFLDGACVAGLQDTRDQSRGHNVRNHSCCAESYCDRAQFCQARAPVHFVHREENCKVPNLFLLEYNDGFRAAVLMLNGYVKEPSAAAYAARVDGRVEACEIYVPSFPAHRPTDPTSRAANFWRCKWFQVPANAPLRRIILVFLFVLTHAACKLNADYGSFAYLAKNIEEMFVTGQAVYPVERVLLTSGVLEAALTGRYLQVGSADGAKDPMPVEDDGTRNVVGDRMLTPWLDVRYKSYTNLPHRPLGPRPTGALVTTMDDRAPNSARL